MPKTYNFGGMQLTQQAYIVLVAGMLVSALIFVGGLFLKGSSAKISAITIAFVALALTCYTSYVINCTIVGKCMKLAWFLTLMALFSFISWFISLAAILGYSKKPSSPSSPRKSSKK
jgi:hypothetical protein